MKDSRFSWRWETDVKLICEGCGRELHPDCDVSNMSINRAFREHCEKEHIPPKWFDLISVV